MTEAQIRKAVQVLRDEGIDKVTTTTGWGSASYWKEKDGTISFRRVELKVIKRVEIALEKYGLTVVITGGLGGSVNGKIK